MKPVFWDSPDFKWDDRNTYWGDPSYQLEPGDPGYVPPPGSVPTSNPQPKPKRKMPKKDYLSDSPEDFSSQLITFKNAIGQYATLFELTAPEVAAQAADADYFDFVLQCLDLMDNTAKQWVAWRNLVRKGGTPPPDGGPKAPVLPTAVPVVMLGIEARFRKLVADLKRHPSYNESIGQALGIEGAVDAGPDMTTLQPVLKLEQSGGAVNIRWGWQGQSAHLDMIELEVNRGGGFQMLAMDTTPNYTDTFAPTAPAKWTYRGIYRVGDARVGQWSSEVSINVAP